MADGYGSPGLSLPSGLPTSHMRVRARFLSDRLRWPADAPVGADVGMHAAAAREPEIFAGRMARRSPARPDAARHV